MHSWLGPTAPALSLLLLTSLKKVLFGSENGPKGLRQCAKIAEYRKDS
jgi:hypothetical protein